MSYDSGSLNLNGMISTTGRWGVFSARRFSEEIVAPEDESVLLRERLERTFALFTGEYTGKVAAYRSSGWNVRLNLYMDEGTDSTGVRRPYLKALYQNTSLSDPTIGSRLMDVSVNMDGCRPLLAMKSDPTPGNPGGGIPGVGLMRFTTEYANGQLNGEIVDHRGPQGVLTATKKK
ncbi:MAG: hypothetical protein HC902_02465 [Calothrix sp. SM1_5_4]|nr:hypothetical protein [Calothrix sp. SM1_5_4]